MPYLQAHFDKEFRCIGPECEDMCCHVWNIVLDKKTYEKYQETPRLRTAAQPHLVRISNSTDAVYAQVKFPTASRVCPFLSEDRWCTIHKDYGPGYLPAVCHSYPRVEQPAGDVTPNPLHLSCPEAARLVLMQKNFVPVERNKTNDRPKLQYFLRMAKQKPKPANGLRKPFIDVRTFSLMLIQDRAYPIWQRLFILGMFSKRLAEVLEENQTALLPGLFSEYADIVKRKRLVPSMDSIPLQTAAQLAAVIQVTHRLQTKNAVFRRMHECIGDFMSGIRYQAHLPVDAIAPAYAEAFARYYHPFFQTHPHILENYLANYILRTQFPFGPVPPGEISTPLTSFFLMCLRFAVVKGLLIGMSGHYREAFAPEHVVKVIQVFTKQVEHCSTFLGGLNHDLMTPSGFALLLKN